MKTIFDITTGVKWIGVQDPDLRTFDVVMETLYGTTYNSYFIEADKKTIIETTKEQFWDEYLYKIQQVCNPADIEYIVLNHTEPETISLAEAELSLISTISFPLRKSPEPVEKNSCFGERSPSV